MKKPYWTQYTHVFRADEYECSACHALYDKPFTDCPNCKSKMGRTKYDASWVIEMAEYDEMFGDDDD